MDTLWFQIQSLYQLVTQSPYLPWVIPVAILLLIGFWRSRKRMEGGTEKMKQGAASVGMEYSAPKGQGYAIGVGIGGGSASLSEGQHTFTGKTNGVEWTVKSVVLAEAGTHSGRRMGKQYTRWSSEGFKTRGQDYLILMDLPENMKKELQAQPKAPAGTGFLATMANKMANMAFSMYTNGYFGKTQMEGTVFDQTHRQYWPTGAFAENYMAFSNSEPFSKKILNAETMDFILKDRPYQLSFLINPNGIMASCPQFVIEPEQVQKIAKFCSDLTNRFQKNQKQE